MFRRSELLFLTLVYVKAEQWIRAGFLHHSYLNGLKICIIQVSKCKKEEGTKNQRKNKRPEGHIKVT
ncbi:hypothetical protein RUMOBE_02359 [Blautia obeum ATCC 29174]|uniref:Uncharacterized protein n=1 Tax=Blautia obeum ATCC 29174 TaxID=411459 RepID=A5ZTN0_9FIRM|nr:hypothetical protein RUMOBE_02359 [Blautia obeum ATCC 29174]